MSYAFNDKTENVYVIYYMLSSPKQYLFLLIQCIRFRCNFYCHAQWLRYVNRRISQQLSCFISAKLNLCCGIEGPCPIINIGKIYHYRFTEFLHDNDKKRVPDHIKYITLCAQLWHTIWLTTLVPQTVSIFKSLISVCMLSVLIVNDFAWV